MNPKQLHCFITAAQEGSFSTRTVKTTLCFLINGTNRFNVDAPFYIKCAG